MTIFLAGATKSFDHFMYKDTAGKYWPFQCGGNKNMPAEFKKANGQFKLPYSENPLTAFRNSYVLIVQKGGKARAIVYRPFIVRWGQRNDAVCLTAAAPSYKAHR